MIETREKKINKMKRLILFVTILLLSTSNVYSKDNNDCKNAKKFSMKAAICKTKSLGGSLKDKLSKKENKNKTEKKSILKKIGEAKTLSDIK